MNDPEPNHDSFLENEEIASAEARRKKEQYIAGPEEIAKMKELEERLKAEDWSNFVHDAADTMTLVLPDPTEIIQGLICEESKLLIGGSSKTYKTWFLMDMGLSISAGKEFLGHACLQRRVLQGRW